MQRFCGCLVGEYAFCEFLKRNSCAATTFEHFAERQIVYQMTIQPLICIFNGIKRSGTACDACPKTIESAELFTFLTFEFIGNRFCEFAKGNIESASGTDFFAFACEITKRTRIIGCCQLVCKGTYGFSILFVFIGHTCGGQNKLDSAAVNPKSMEQATDQQ